MSIISIIVPVYKVEPYLRRCVDSILAQTFTDFELILVDDGSPDNCGAICDDYAQKDSRVHVIHQENGGLSAARNAGIDWVFANSNSEWLNFVDSDDWVHPQMLERLYRAVLEHDVKVSICGYEETDGDIRWTNEDTVTVRLWPVERYYVEQNINATVAWGKLYHRECFTDIRYPVGKIHEDEYVTYRILFAYEHVAVIDSPMYAYFMNPEGITRSEWTLKRLDATKALEEQISFFDRQKFSRIRNIKIDQYMRILCGQSKRIQKEEDEHKRKAALRYVRRRLIKGLIKYHEMFPFEEKWWFIYESAFPRLMNAYWLSGAAKNKVKRLFGHSGRG